MKRSALKRKTPMARGTTTLRRTTPLAPSKPKRRAKISTEVAGQVARLSNKRCVRCGTRRALQRHHVLPVRLWPEYETVAFCMVLVCAGCHDEHERAHRRLRLGELPDVVVAWARSRGGREAAYMDATYRDHGGGRLPLTPFET